MSRFEFPLNPLDNPVVEAADQLRRGVCIIRRRFPEMWQPIDTASGELSPIPAVRNLNRRAWDYICPDEPLNSSFYPEGGQCPNIAYDIQLVRDNGQNQNWSFASGGGFVLGPIDEIRREISVADPNNPALFQNITYRLVKNGQVVRTRSFGAPGVFQVTAGWFVRIITQNNVPDVCAGAPILRGNVPPIQINIPINLGGQSFNIPFDLDFNVDVGGIPININPIFNTPIGIIAFPPGAVDIDFAPEFNFAPDVTVNPPTGGGATPDQIQNIINNQTTEIESSTQTIINQVISDEVLVKLCCISDNLRLLFQEPQYTTQSNVFTNQSGDVYLLPDDCVGVIVRAVTPIPSKVSAQEGSGQAPRVYYLGWISFGFPGVDGSERLPWHFQEQWLPVPAGADRVLVSANFGALFNLSFVISEAPQPTDCCL